MTRAATMVALTIWTSGSVHADAQQPAKEAIPKVTGQWTGTWGPLLPKSADAADKKPEMGLVCTVSSRTTPASEL
jgi:hypothetical protein